MGAQQTSSRIMSQICDDVGHSGFDGDDMLDMQTRIGSYSSLQKRLSSPREPPTKENLKVFYRDNENVLYADLQGD